MAVAVVGGGMAGVSAARVLSRQGRIVKGVGEGVAPCLAHWAQKERSQDHR